MARRPRIEFYGATYHIIHRGNNKAYIFDSDAEKVQFLSILVDLKTIFDFSLFAYVIMGNHYHLAIKTHNIPISQIMHRLNTRYAKYYNKKYERTGSPFEGRYKGILVQDDNYLIQLINYIHNNPVYANITKDMKEYKWSSDSFYRMNVKNIVDIDYILELFSQDRQRAIIEYKELMKVRTDEYKVLKNQYEYEQVIGDKGYINTLDNPKDISLEDILLRICPNEKLYELIKSGSRKRDLTFYKYRYIQGARRAGYTDKDIGEFIGISGAAVRQISITSF